MKTTVRFLVLFMFSLWHLPADAQHAFSKVFYDSTNAGYAYAITPSFDKGEMVAGTMAGSGIVMKLDSAGNLVWSRLYTAGTSGTSGTSETRFYSIIQTADSGFMLAGSVRDSTNNSDALCMKVNSAGDTLWTRKLGTALREEGVSVEATYDGGFVVVGYTLDPTLPYWKTILFKLDAAGSMVWNQSLSYRRMMGYSVKQTQDSGFIITGNFVDSFPNYHSGAFLVKVDASGLVSWAKNYYTVGQSTEGMDVAVMPGGYILYLTKYYNSALMKVDLNGNVEWINRFPGLIVNHPYSHSIPHARLIKTSDGGLAFVNGVSDYNHFGIYYLLKTDSNGINAVGEQLILNALALHENADKSISVAGNGPLYQLRTTTIPYPDHFGVLRTDSLWHNPCAQFYGWRTSQPDAIDTMSLSLSATPTGVLTPVYPVITPMLPLSDSGCIGLSVNTQEISAEPLISIYPNPASSEINFSFAQVASPFKLTILNTMGQVVFSKTLSGVEGTTFSMTSNFPNGIYTAILTSDKSSFCKKIIIQ